MSLRNLLTTLQEGAEKGVRGFGEGATLGLIKYPQAALKSLVTGETYGQSLADIERQRRALENSGAYQVARVVGGFAPAIASGGGTLPVVMAKQAGQGAISGFTANEGMDNVLQDVGMGAGMGGAFGLLGGGVQAVSTGAKRALSKNPAVIQAQTEIVAQKAVNQYTKLLENPTAKRIYDEFLSGARKPLSPTDVTAKLTTPEALAAYNTAREVAKKSNPAGVTKDVQKVASSLTYGTQPGGTKLAKQVEQGRFEAPGKVLLSDLMEDAKALAPLLVGGGVVGYGLGTSGLLGENVDPYQAALGIALAGGGLSALPQVGNLKMKGIQTGLAMLPRQQKQAALPPITKGYIGPRVVASPTVASSVAGAGFTPEYLRQQEGARQEEKFKQLQRDFSEEDEKFEQLKKIFEE